MDIEKEIKEIKGEINLILDNGLDHDSKIDRLIEKVFIDLEDRISKIERRD